MALSTTKQGSLGTDNTQINQYQTQSQINAAPKSIPGVSNGVLPKLNNGDTSTTIDGSQLIIRQGAAKGTSFTFAISNAATGLTGYQTGTVPPSVATNFPDEGDFGWYEDTTGPTYYFTINHGGSLVNISLSTLDGTIADLSGSITANQHGALGRVTTTGSNPLHTNATTTEAGFLSTTFFDLLNGATATINTGSPTANDTLALRSATGGIQFTIVNLITTTSAGPSLLINGTAIQSANTAIATSAATADTLARRTTGGACNFGALVCTTLTASSTAQATTYNSTSSSYSSNGTKVVGAQGAAIADASTVGAAPTQAEFNALVGTVNTILARLRAHGLIAT